MSALILSACGGSDSGSGKDIITVNGSEPQSLLIPTAINEVGGGRIVGLLFSQLVRYSADGQIELDVAESIDTADSVVYEVNLKKGLQFTNGEPVDSAAFVDAWNYGALATNAQLSADFFAPIKGYDLVSEINPETGAPFAQTMSGLEVVSDHIFKITLDEPVSDFSLRLGYSAFAPLPKTAFADMKVFGESPVGNGPYKLASDRAWQHNVQIDLLVNPDYKGDFVAKNRGVTFKFYSSLDAAYQDLQANNLDVLDTIPASALQTYRNDLGERVMSAETARNAMLSVPEYLPAWSGEVGKLRRQALSYAINREEISKVIFNDTVTPALDFSAPVLTGWSDSLVGNEVLKYDQDKARKLWEEADALQPWDGSTFTIAYNSDGNHKAWVDAIANGVKNTLGIQAEGKPYPTFAALRNDVTGGVLTGASRSGWQADYPSVANFLLPNFFTGAGSNDSKYSSAVFDALMQQGNTADSVEKGIGFYKQGQEVLLQDLPTIPLWYDKSVGGHSKTVEDVKFVWNGEVRYGDITIK